VPAVRDTQEFIDACDEAGIGNAFLGSQQALL